MQAGDLLPTLSVKVYIPKAKVFSRQFVISVCTVLPQLLRFLDTYTRQGQIQDFKLGGAHLKKLHRAEEGANILGVFRVKNHYFTPKKHNFFHF